MAKLTDKIGSFTAVPDVFIKNSVGLSDHARWVFICLRHYTNNRTETAFPSYDQLQQVTGYARATLAKAIKELIEAGWVEKKRRFSQSTVYTTRIPDTLISSPCATNDTGDISSHSETNVDTSISSPVRTAISSLCVNTNQTIEPDEYIGANAPTVSIADATKPTTNTVSRTDNMTQPKLDPLSHIYERSNATPRSIKLLKKYARPEDTQALEICQEFYSMTAIEVTSDANAKTWLSAAREMVIGRVTVADLRQAYQESKRWTNGRVTDPYSLKGTAAAIAAKRNVEASKPKVIYTPVFN